MKQLRLKASLTILVAFIAIFTITLSGCTKKPEERTKEVHVAFNIPITGMFGIYGQTIRDGALMALEDIQKQEGAVKFKFDIQDNAGKPSETVSIMQKQFFKPVDIYVSGVKPQTMAIFDQVKAKGIPHFVWIFDAFICAQNENTFRTWVSYKFEPGKYMQYIKYRNAKRIAITYVNLPHVDEEINKILIPELRKIGITKNDITIEVYEWTQKDFKNIVAKIKSFNPDLIILNGFQGNLVGLVKSLRSYNMIHDGNVIATYDMLDAAPLLSTAELEGIRLIAPKFNVEGNSTNLIKWREKFKKTYSRDPLYTDAYSYDMVQILADAAKRVKSSHTSEDWISAIQETNIPGLTGNLSFDKDGDLKLSLKIGVFRDGKILLDESEK